MNFSVLDSNVFFHYVDDTRDCHIQAKNLIDSNKPLFTCKRVQKEIEKILRERRKLNIEIQKYLHDHPDLSGFTPSPELKDRELEYLEDLNSMHPQNMKIRLNFHMHYEEPKMRETLSSMQEIIKAQNYWQLEEELKSIVDNTSDALILSDSISWCKNRDGSCYFYSRDKKDFIDNKTEIEQKIYEFFMEETLLNIINLEDFT